MKTRSPQPILIAITTALILLSSLNVALAQPEWSLQIKGEVSNTLSLTMDQVIALPAATVQGDIYCNGAFVTGGSWMGPKLSQILQMAELGSQAESVEFAAADGYMVTIPKATAMREDVILACQLNEQTLPEGLRLVLPGANGNMWIAGIIQITVTGLPSNDPPHAFALPNFNVPTSIPAPPPTPAPTPTPQPANQTATPPVPTPTESQPPQQSSSTQNQLSTPDHTPTFAAITAAVAMATLATGYVLRKRKIASSAVFSPKP